MFNRRRFLGGELGLALAGAWSTVRKATSEPAARDFFKELGERVSVSLVAFGTLLMIPALAHLLRPFLLLGARS